MPVLRLDPKFELRTRAFVSKLIYDKQGKKVTGVLYTDMKTGEEYEQPAGRAVPCGTPAFGSEWKRATVKWYYHFTRFRCRETLPPVPRG